MTRYVHFIDERKHIKSDRRLGEREIQFMKAEITLMEILKTNKVWVGDGTLYQTTGKNEFHFVDQKYQEEN